MQITTIPRVAVKSALDALRLPLSTIERISGQSENEAWPPALIFEDFQANAKQFAGGLLRDQTLVEEGRIQSVKVNELRRSLDLRVKAEQTREQADAQFAQQREAAERERQQAEKQAREREAAVARRKREAEQKVQAETQRKAEAVAKADRAREDRVAAVERNARLNVADAQTTALAKEKKAVASVEKVVQLADAVETKKAQRKSS
ncbi:MAG: hypothetical protein QOJ00_2809 [Actinomycetota bacterium]